MDTLVDYCFIKDTDTSADKSDFTQFYTGTPIVALLRKTTVGYHPIKLVQSAFLSLKNKLQRAKGECLGTDSR